MLRSKIQLFNYCRHSAYVLARFKGSDIRVVLLPEDPVDTPETNPLLQTENFPRFDEFSSKSLVAAAAKHAINFEYKSSLIFEKAKTCKFSEGLKLFEELEQAFVPVLTLQNLITNLRYTKCSESLRLAYERINDQVSRVSSDRWACKSLHDLAYNILENSPATKLTDAQKSLLEFYLFMGKAYGVQLNEKLFDRYEKLVHTIRSDTSRFRFNALTTGYLFSSTVDDLMILSDMPKDILFLMAEDKTDPISGPWTVTLDEPIYRAFMTYCSDRLLRWNAWRAYHNKGSPDHAHLKRNNSLLINHIRQCRYSGIKALYHKSFVDLRLSTQMAGNIKSVVQFLDKCQAHFQPIAERELLSIQEFAATTQMKDLASRLDDEGKIIEDGKLPANPLDLLRPVDNTDDNERSSNNEKSPDVQHKFQLQSWDVAYWGRRHAQQTYGLNRSSVSEYFPLEMILKKLSALCSLLFGITIKKDETNDISVWSEDVELYHIYDNATNELMGSFYFDAFARPSEKFILHGTQEGRLRCDALNLKPYSFLYMNLFPPLKGMPSFLEYKDLLDLFSRFGDILQQLLTTVPYPELSGQHTLTKDTRSVVAEMMCLWPQQPRILQWLSSHYRTGKALPDQSLPLITQESKHLLGYEMVYDIYRTMFDLEMYLSDERKVHWGPVMERLWKEVIPVLPYTEDDYEPCSMYDIFSGDLSALSYSKLWNKSIGAELFDAFLEVTPDLSDIEALSAVGKRFRETYLSLSSSVSPVEIFRRFRGRDPSHEPFLRLTKTLDDVKNLLLPSSISSQTCSKDDISAEKGSNNNLNRGTFGKFDSSTGNHKNGRQTFGTA